MDTFEITDSISIVNNEEEKKEEIIDFQDKEPGTNLHLHTYNIPHDIDPTLQKFLQDEKEEEERYDFNNFIKRNEK